MFIYHCHIRWSRGAGHRLDSKPLQLSFRVKPRHPSLPLFLRCAVRDATNYDILVSQQAFYSLALCLDNWTEEAWIGPGWSAGDGRKEPNPVVFP